MQKIIPASHHTVYVRPSNDLFGYFAWPSILRTRSGAIYVGVSGFRNAHVCPFGKSVLFRSHDDGCNWSSPMIVNDSLIDDRDVGLLELGNGELVMSWFTSDTRVFYPGDAAPNRINIRPILDSWEDAAVDAELGSFLRIRGLDGVWGKKIPVPVSAPHGPIRLSDSTLFYLGYSFRKGSEKSLPSEIEAVISNDDGKTWEIIGKVPQGGMIFHEPHAVELDGNRILGLLRWHDDYEFTMWQTISEDRGKSWSVPRFVANGSPPHLLRHSQGVLICSYGYRKNDFGQRVMFSCDDGRSWSTDWILRNDGINIDLGYPATTELEDGSLLTVYYQCGQDSCNCGLYVSRWNLPSLQSIK